MKRRWLVIGAIATVVYLGNASWLASRLAQRPVLLAHRGIHQQFDKRDLRADASFCTATRMLPSTHTFLENTIASMHAGFAAGADIIEIDVHPTTDGHFAVFHDWFVDCRTDGHGVTREHSLAALKQLDVGYGYTADGGRTYPFRGLGIGLISSLDEVLAAFPERRFLIDVKSNDPEEGRQLARVLGGLPVSRQRTLMVYGGDKPVAEVRRLLPQMRTATRGSLKTCWVRYMLVGWSGWVPQSCRQALLIVPLHGASWTWGWPNRLLQRMESVGSEVFVSAPQVALLAGINSRAELDRLPPDYSGGIWTDQIEVIAPLVAQRTSQVRLR